MNAILRTLVALLMPVLAQYAVDALAAMQATVPAPWPHVIGFALSIFAAFKILPKRQPVGQATSPLSVPPPEPDPDEAPTPAHISDEAPRPPPSRPVLVIAKPAQPGWPDRTEDGGG